MQPQLPDGYSVHYTHIRMCVGFSDDVIVLATAAAARLQEWEILPYGGATIATIMDGDKKVVARGEAYCMTVDNYRKSTGRLKALGRALKELPRVN